MSIAADEENFLLNVGRRLAQERERLGLTQDQLGKLCGGITARTIISWEGGAKIPSHRLAMLIPSGIDVWHVLTGDRRSHDSSGGTCDCEISSNRTKPQESISESKSCYESHSNGGSTGKRAIRYGPKQAEFLEFMSRLTPEQQDHVLEIIKESAQLNALKAKVAELEAKLNVLQTMCPESALLAK